MISVVTKTKKTKGKYKEKQRVLLTVWLIYSCHLATLLHCRAFRSIPFYRILLNLITLHSNPFHSIALYTILLHYISLHSHSIPFHYILLNSIAFYLIPFLYVLLYSILLHSIPLHFIPRH